MHFELFLIQTIPCNFIIISGFLTSYMIFICKGECRRLEVTKLNHKLLTWDGNANPIKSKPLWCFLRRVIPQADNDGIPQRTLGRMNDAWWRRKTLWEMFIMNRHVWGHLNFRFLAISSSIFTFKAI